MGVLRSAEFGNECECSGDVTDDNDDDVVAVFLLVSLAETNFYSCCVLVVHPSLSCMILFVLVCD